MSLALLLCAAGAAQAVEELNPAARASIDKGLDWLLKAQNPDGSWGLEAKSTPDVTCTAVAGLALLAAGENEREGQRERASAALRKATEYILKRARKAPNDIAHGETTLIQNKLGATVHNHFAVIYLTQVYGMRLGEFGGSEDSEELAYAIRKMTDHIAKTQEPDGSWHKNTFGSLKATCMAWLALRSAAGTGIPIRHAAVDRTVKFIKDQYNPSTKLYDGGAGGMYGGYQSMYSTASCLRVLAGMGAGGEERTLAAMDAFIEQASRGAWKEMFLSVEGEDFLAAAMMSHTLVGENGPRWEKWFPFVRDRLARRQNADGSWTTTACISGRTFATACALLALQTPNRLLPLQQ
ncbi:MAG: terpene cyclase/mutase family protein [Planctomycetota bacterium]|nr:terpene cyclase/mutase family protein [Planctomycetota bacterium]